MRALVVRLKGVNALALYIALSFLFIYYSKNKEYYLDLFVLSAFIIFIIKSIIIGNKSIMSI
jgi:hypothetical protein